MRQLIYFILISHFLSCQKDEFQSEIVGVYQTINYSKPLKFYQDINGIRRVVGLSLELNSDSTFVFGTCTSITNGTWTKHKNLVLKSDTTIYKPHFLNSRLCVSVPEHKGKLLTFEIINEKLVAKSPKNKGIITVFGMEKSSN